MTADKHVMPNINKWVFLDLLLIRLQFITSNEFKASLLLKPIINIGKLNLKGFQWINCPENFPLIKVGIWLLPICLSQRISY